MPGSQVANSGFPLLRRSAAGRAAAFMLILVLNGCSSGSVDAVHLERQHMWELGELRGNCSTLKEALARTVAQIKALNEQVHKELEQAPATVTQWLKRQGGEPEAGTPSFQSLETSRRKEQALQKEVKDRSC